MTRSKRMQPVQRVAEKRENDAAHRMSESRQQLAHQETRLKELQAYRDQYAAQFSERGNAGLDSMQLQDYRVFLSRLNEAICQQELVIAQCRSRHVLDQDQWTNRRCHTQAVDNLIERFRKDEQRQQHQREQQLQDDHSQRGRRQTDKS